MNLRKSRDRDWLSQQLNEGSTQTRAATARQVLPLLSSVLLAIRSEKDAARARYDSVRDATGEPEASHPAINPVLAQKASVYKFWAPIILFVEIGLAGLCASLTIAGGFVVHLIAGVLATMLFCGLAKLAVSTLVDGDRVNASIKKLEVQLQREVLLAAILVGIFFVSRFFFFAQITFAITSTLLSFAVAAIVALCFTLGDLLGAANKELAAFIELSLMETEIGRLRDVAEKLVAGEGAQTEPSPARAGLAVVGLVALLLQMPGRAAADDARTLQIWVDVSGSMATPEWIRLREEVLLEPLPLLEVAGIERLSLTPFALEADALTGSPHRWVLAPLTRASCTPKPTVFKATAAARELECAEAKRQARESWRTSVAGQLAEYQQVLAAVDVGQEQKQTCLFPVLSRIAASPASSSHLIVTDGAHAACGPPPTEPVQGVASGIVILMPDSGGDGMAGRMKARSATLRRLYPNLMVVESWKLTGIGSWLEFSSR